MDAGPGGRWADFDADTDVDCTDWEAFKLAWTDTANDPPIFFPCFTGGPIPTVANWGIAVMALLVMTAATLVFTTRRERPILPQGMSRNETCRTRPLPFPPTSPERQRRAISTASVSERPTMQTAPPIRTASVNERPSPKG